LEFLLQIAKLRATQRLQVVRPETQGEDITELVHGFTLHRAVVTLILHRTVATFKPHRAVVTFKLHRAVVTLILHRAVVTFTLHRAVVTFTLHRAVVTLTTITKVHSLRPLSRNSYIVISIKCRYPVPHFKQMAQSMSQKI